MHDHLQLTSTADPPG